MYQRVAWKNDVLGVGKAFIEFAYMLVIKRGTKAILDAIRTFLLLDPESCPLFSWSWGTFRIWVGMQVRRENCEK